MPRWLTHGPTLSRPPASRHWWVQPRQQSGVTCHAWANASRSTVAPATGNRWPPGEGVHHRQDPALSQGEVEAIGPFQRAGQQVRPGAGGTDDEYGLTDLPAVDHQDVRARRLGPRRW